ncbi:ABC transporter ATP-binding protein [Clostridium estertheticum]|uniref:ABC transporter ATP-binding protein n=2 Tax=Clostridium estertheticum TaxID=238834 RepID=A0A7Y3WU36_9CLOT|nr:ABC transporter ATP-binding protein [Clostridium estertheticum]NNU77746.1 ABC transporter ATP-binding protein [Clostridium estertheticum]WBL45550.1 ABC transporter ATP-binding protein [Clostridium estertheticum]
MMENSESIISIKNLQMSYGNKLVLNGINLEIPRGQIIGYIGTNGAGKSTTIKIMLGILEGYSGTVEILGQDISNGSIEYKKKIGYVPELADIYENLTAYEYISFLGGIYGLEEKKLIERAEKLMGLFAMDNVINSRISSYSKGMKQKLLIICSLIHNPDILFFDEPLSGLDANSVMVFKEVMKTLAKGGKTIFYSSHIMDVVEKVSDRIILLNAGQIVADGSFEELNNNQMEGSLEEIFNQLTGFNEHTAIAEEFVSLVEEV